jgi:hypothetical protein
MRALAKIAIALTFVSAIAWSGHHHNPHYYGYAGLHAEDGQASSGR